MSSGILSGRRHIRGPIKADGSDKTASWSVSNYYILGKKEMPEGLSVFGGKTGTTQAAGYCLIMGERDADGKEYASVVMHADSRDASIRYVDNH